MLRRPRYEAEIHDALRRSPVVLIVGARQVGKTTLARTIVPRSSPNYFDLENPVDLVRLSEPMLGLEALRGVVVIDEVQRHPDLFSVLRVLADREERPATFLVLGSASPQALRQSAESLAGRIEVIELPGLGAADLGGDADHGWLRGGFPRSTLADSDADSLRWRESYIRTLAQRDLHEFGLSLPAATIERFLGIVAHHHANLWNAASVARALSIGEATARRYVDALSDAMLVRVLQPWHSDAGKRLVRTPKVLYRDTGVLHALWGVETWESLQRHAAIGSSWESFVIEETLRRAPQTRPFFWRTGNGAEVDLVLDSSGRRIGIEVKRADAPRLTTSIRSAMNDTALALDRLWVVYPGRIRYELAERVTVLPLCELLEADAIGAL